MENYKGSCFIFKSHWKPKPMHLWLLNNTSCFTSVKSVAATVFPYLEIKLKRNLSCFKLISLLKLLFFINKNMLLINAHLTLQFIFCILLNQISNFLTPLKKKQLTKRLSLPLSLFPIWCINVIYWFFFSLVARSTSPQFRLYS